jgi:hypothetical protein
MKNIKFQIIESSVTDNKFPSSAVLLAKWFDRLRSKRNPQTVRIMQNIREILSAKFPTEEGSDLLRGPPTEGSSALASDMSSDMAFVHLTYNTQNMREHGLRQGLRDELKGQGGFMDSSATGPENISDEDFESIDIKGSISYGNVHNLKPLMPLDPTVNDSIVFTNVDPSSLKRYLEIDDPHLDELFVKYSQNSPGNRFVLKIFNSCAVRENLDPKQYLHNFENEMRAYHELSNAGVKNRGFRYAKLVAHGNIELNSKFIKGKFLIMEKIKEDYEQESTGPFIRAKIMFEAYKQVYLLAVQYGILQDDLNPGNLITNSKLDPPSVTMIDFARVTFLKDVVTKSSQHQIHHGDIEDLILKYLEESRETLQIIFELYGYCTT